MDSLDVDWGSKTEATNKRKVSVGGITDPSDNEDAQVLVELVEREGERARQVRVVAAVAGQGGLEGLKVLHPLDRVGVFHDVDLKDMEGSGLLNKKKQNKEYPKISDIV